MPRDRYLVLGGSGVLGHRLRIQLGDGAAVSTYTTHPFPHGVSFDATRERVRDLVTAHPGDYAAAFLLFGNTNMDACARDPAGTARVNVEALCRAIDDLVDLGIKPVFASSDAVYDGSCGPWSEGARANPILTYGRQKLEVEEHLATVAGPWVAARLSKILDIEPRAGNPLADWSTQIERGETIRCATDLVFTPIDSRDAASALVALAGMPHRGVFNVCGPTSLARSALLDVLIGELGRHGVRTPSVIHCSIRDFPFAEPRPLDLSMSATKLLRATGIALRDPRETCREFAAKRHS